MHLKKIIDADLTGFLKLCNEHDVKSLYAFGSSATGNFNEDTSDIDLLVELATPDPIERGENLMDLWEKFEHFFNRKVDLLTSTSIRNSILRTNIETTKIFIYDGQRQKVSV